MKKPQIRSAGDALIPLDDKSSADEDRRNDRENEGLLPVSANMLANEIRQDGSAELLGRQISDTHDSCHTQNSHGQPPHDTIEERVDGRMLVIHAGVIQSLKQVINDRNQHVTQNFDGVQLTDHCNIDAGISLNQSVHSHESHDNTSL